MTIKILQLNMWAGTHFPAIKEFLSKNDFDILCFQEVAGIGATHGNVDATIDCFKELSLVLGKTHVGQLAISQYAQSSPKTGYFGNAIFYKKEFSLLKQHVLWLHKRRTPFPKSATSFEKVGRNVLHLTLKKDNQIFDILCTHLAWAKTKVEQPHQIQQNRRLIEYVKTLPKPWILSGDFNINLGQPTLIELQKLGHNLTKEYGIKNTIDPLHRAWERLKPGFAIDYIFVSPDVQVNSFEALDHVHMSDHLGLTAEIEI